MFRSEISATTLDEPILDHYATARRAGLRGNDAWIAAATVQVGAILVTANQVFARRASAAAASSVVELEPAGQGPTLRSVLVAIDDALEVEVLERAQELADLQTTHIGNGSHIG